MFNNLIESSSHRGELKRRGSFFLFTVATYALLFVISGVVSIYAYDMRLGEQNFEVVTMMPLVDFPLTPNHTPARQPEVSTNNTSRNLRDHDERATSMVSVNRPDVAPKDVSTTPNKVQPIRDGVHTIITARNLDGDFIRPGGSRDGAGVGTSPVTTIEITTPPPDPAPKPAPKTIRASEVLNGQAITLPKPVYSQMARELKIQGRVNVQVLIDETGKVISAKAIDGHPLLRIASERAAYQAQFSPTLLSRQPVKVSGLITYNFVLQ